MARVILVMTLLLWIISVLIHAEDFNIDEGIKVQLVWETEGADLDLYIINPDYDYCYWNNKSTKWGCQYDYDSMGGAKRREAKGQPADPFPYMEQATSNLIGLQAIPGTYRVGVHYYPNWNNTPKDKVYGSVDVYQYSRFVGNFPVALNKGEAKIIWEIEVGTQASLSLPQCEIYGVHDDGLNNSLFFKLNMETYEIQSLVEPSKNGKALDIEALDIHPNTQILFATSSKDALEGPKGFLYKINLPDGTLSSIGPTGYKSVDSLSFHPSGVLWGWAKGEGLITIDTSSGVSQRVFASKQIEIDDIAWNPAGTKLYAAQGKILWVYQLNNNQLEVACKLHGKTEALEMITSRMLLVSFDNDKTSQIQVLDVENHCAELESISMPISYDDIEGLAWVCQSKG